MKPSVDFDIQDEDVEPTVGVRIMNVGPGPAVIKKVTYYVDRKPVRDEEEAIGYGKLSGSLVRYYSFDEDDTLAKDEQHFLFYLSTKHKKELDRFIDFIDEHLAIEVTYCSLKGDCVTKCSTKGRC